MPSADECLRWCKPLTFVLETRLNNTQASDWGFEDVPGGQVPVAGFNDTITTGDNSLVRVSNRSAYNAGASEIVLRGVQYRRSLSEPFQGGSTVSQSKLFIQHRSTDIWNRDWERKDYTLKVGGHYKRGTAEDEVLRYGDYPTWITGRITAKDFDEREMGVFFNASPKQLENIWPLNKFTSGRAQGKTKPFVVGEVRSMEPVETGDTTGVFHDGDCEGIQTAWDLNGNVLTLEAGDPLTGTVSAADKYMADTSGNVAWHSTVEGVRLHVKGMKIDGTYSDKANEIVAELVKQATSDTVVVTHAFDGKQIGWVFYDQAQIKEQISTILEGLDCFYSENEADNSITIKRRYNGQANDLDGNANARNAFDFGAVGQVDRNLRQLRPVARPKVVTVLYNKNFAPLPVQDVPASLRQTLTYEWDRRSYAVFEGTGSEMVVECALTQDADAEEMGRMAADRYGLKAFEYSWVEPKIGHGVLEGDVGTLKHALVKPNTYAEIREVETNTETDDTSFKAVIYG